MTNFIIDEDTLHYAVRFLERWADKAPHQDHINACKKMRNLSDYLLDNMYNPMLISVLRKPKTK